MTERAGASPSSEAGGEAMRCSSCQHDNDQGVRSCARCGRPLGPVDLERVRAQLRRWQERLLDLTKANPLLGINRSRVSKLRVSEPDAQALFDEFVVSESSLEMPMVRKERPGPARELEETPSEAEPIYVIEHGDIVFDARPNDLARRLRRIYDNAR